MRQSLYIIYLLMAMGVTAHAAHALQKPAGLYVPSGELPTTDGEPDVMYKDRYGREYVIWKVSGSSSLNEQWLREGKAMLWDRGSDAIPYTEWLPVERDARRANKGLWQTQEIYDASADVPLGKRAVVRGKVLDTQRRNGNIYINFGKDWREDFTLFVPKKHAKEVTDEAMKALIGKTVLARGLVYDYYGPMMDLYRLEMLEMSE